MSGDEGDFYGLVGHLICCVCHMTTRVHCVTPLLAKENQVILGAIRLFHNYQGT